MWTEILQRRAVFMMYSAAVKPILPRLKTKRSAISVQSQNTVSGEVVMTKTGSSSGGTIPSSHQKPDLRTRDTLMPPSVSSSSGSDHTLRGGLSRNGLRNLRCNSVSDVLATKSISGTKISVTKKRNSDGESSSSSQGSKSSVSVMKGRNQSSSHGNGVTVSDNRRNRMVPTIRDNSVVSSSGRRSWRLGAVSSPAASRHSDMRIDIDNMSYEELLALGDEIGTVSTALSEEALSRSLKKSIYQETDETGAISLDKDDDIKCSICQEEYVDGDEVGTMPCEHMYHM